MTFNYKQEESIRPDYDVKDNIELIKKLLSKIKEKYKICLILSEIKQMSYKEIAKILNISLSSVKSRIHRGKNELLRLYKQEVGL